MAWVGGGHMTLLHIFPHRAGAEQRPAVHRLLGPAQSRLSIVNNMGSLSKIRNISANLNCL